MHANRRLPELAASLPIKGNDKTALAGADDDLPRGSRNACRRKDWRDLEVGVEEVKGLDLVEPLQLSRAVDGEFRFGVQVRGWPAGAVRECRGARPGRGVVGSPVTDTGCGIDRRRVPVSATAVHLGIPPEVAVLDGIEGPLIIAGLLIERVDDAHATSVLRLLVFEVDRADVDSALVRGQLLGDSLEVCGDSLGPKFISGLRVPRRDRVVIAGDKHLAVVVADAIWAEG